MSAATLVEPGWCGAGANTSPGRRVRAARHWDNPATLLAVVTGAEGLASSESRHQMGLPMTARSRWVDHRLRSSGEVGMRRIRLVHVGRGCRGEFGGSGSATPPPLPAPAAAPAAATASLLPFPSATRWPRACNRSPRPTDRAPRPIRVTPTSFIFIGRCAPRTRRCGWSRWAARRIDLDDGQRRRPLRHAGTPLVTSLADAVPFLQANSGTSPT